MVNNKLIAVFITGIILTFLIISGPANAYLLGLTVDDTEIVSGETITFVASAEITPEDMNNATSFIIDLSGPVSISCSFLPNGTKISSCNGFSITVLSTPNQSNGYGYGYGYGLHGIYSYKIEINTTGFPDGIYASKFIVLSGSQVSPKDGENILIDSEQPKLYSCSIRGNDGSVTVGNTTMTGKAELNFNIPNQNAVNGQGFLILSGKDRFSFKFDVVKILKNDLNTAKIQVSGKYRVGRETEKNVLATLTLNKNSNTVDISSSAFNAAGLKVTFKKGCD